MDEIEQQAKVEREYIAEINERIFKIHKAIKEKQFEEKKLLDMTKDYNRVDLALHCFLEKFEQLSIGIFTNNTVSFYY
jgi:hypothetical protein